MRVIKYILLSPFAVMYVVCMGMGIFIMSILCALFFVGAVLPEYAFHAVVDILLGGHPLSIKQFMNEGGYHRRNV